MVEFPQNAIVLIQLTNDRPPPIAALRSKKKRCEVDKIRESLCDLVLSVSLGKKSCTWWLIPRIVSELVHPGCFYGISRVSPLKNWGYNLFTKRDEPPSR